MDVGRTQDYLLTDTESVFHLTMAKVIDLTHVTQRTPATPKRTRHANRDRMPQVKGRRNTGGGFKHHGHEASRVICNRNMWKAGAGIIWNQV